MAQVFISYARKDGRNLADRLAARLEEHDHHPWLDRSEIQGGSDWSRSIEAAIDTCDILLAVLTHGSFDSVVCRGEQARALRKGKPVVPLLAQPDADRPVYLETTHYLDFSDEEAFDEKLSELRLRIEAGEGIRVADLPARVRKDLDIDRPLHSMAAAFGGRSASWSDIRSMTAQQRGRFLDVVSGRGEAIGIYEPELYVERRTAEQELFRFMDGEAMGLLVLGDSGVGKTNLLCAWTGGIEEEGHAVLMYHGDKLRSSEMETELARDLGLEDPSALPSALAVIDDLASQEGRQLVIVLDGMNRFRGRHDEGTRDLLEGTDSLISRLPGSNIRVVLTCTTPAWAGVDRQGDLRLSWSRYHRTVEGEEAVLLGTFTEAEAEEAYERYRVCFGLETTRAELPAALELRLHEPLLLRFFAETGQAEASGVDEPVADSVIFRRYFEDRLRGTDDRFFVEALVDEMYQKELASLPLQDLMRHESLGEDVRSDEPDSSYRRLLDSGVLVQVEGEDRLFDDDRVRFSYPMVGAYALARQILRRDRVTQPVVQELVQRSRGLPFAWDTARTLLVERGEDVLVSSLARSDDLELRELALEALTGLHHSEGDRTRSILTDLLEDKSVEGQRTALRAAYAIGPATRGLFLKAALSRSEALRQTVRDTLYLIWSGTAPGVRDSSPDHVYFLWRQAPDFTHGVLRDLLARVSWLRPREAARILRFVLDLSITIYINHCDRREVAEQTAALFYDLAVTRLHLDKLKLGSRVEGVVLKAVSAVFSGRVLNWMLVGDGADHRAFFALSEQRRGVLTDLSPLLDPAVSLENHEELLHRALESDIGVFSGSGALVLAIHAHAHFDEVEGFVRRLFEQLGTGGKLWELLAFSVLLPTTPEGWTPLLEEFTGDLVRKHPGTVFDPRAPLREFNVFMVPLGLAYGKREGGMPLFDELLAGDFPGADPSQVERIIAGMGPVGFYHPRATLSTLRQHVERLLERPEHVAGLVTALGTMRSLHVDLVDSFMLRMGFTEFLRRQVVATADSPHLHHFVHLLGHYNNAVHYCLNHPRMREDLGMFALERLAHAENADEFIVDYAQQGIRMARAADFDLLEWTKP